MDDEIDKLMIDLDKESDEAEKEITGKIKVITPINSIDDLFKKYDITNSTELSPLEIRDWIFCGTLGSLAGFCEVIQNSVNDKLTNEEFSKRLDSIEKKLTDGKTTAMDHGPMYGAGSPQEGVHRQFGPQHDIFRLPEIIRQVKNGRWETLMDGRLISKTRFNKVSREYFQTDDPGLALLIVLLHLTSDFFTKRSLPIPGTSYLAESSKTVKWIVKLYKEGGNLRQLVSEMIQNFSTTVIIKLFTYLYRQIDLYMRDEELKLSLASDVRYQELCRNSFVISFSISAVDGAVTGNPFKLNLQHYAMSMYSIYKMNNAIIEKEKIIIKDLEDYEDWLNNCA